MFALQVTEYPELEQTAKELGLLDKLYSLYTEAVSTIDNFADISWSDAVANIENMNEVRVFVPPRISAYICVSDS